MKLEELDIVTASETGFVIEPVEGVKIRISGPYSRKSRLAEIAHSQRLESIPKDLSPEDFAVHADAYTIKKASDRIMAWEGIEEPCTPENAELLCTINPAIRIAILQEAEKQANFMIRK